MTFPKSDFGSGGINSPILGSGRMDIMVLLRLKEVPDEGNVDNEYEIAADKTSKVTHLDLCRQAVLEGFANFLHFAKRM